jgi:Zn-dependent protease with chaperone function
MRFALLGSALVVSGFMLASTICALAVALLYRLSSPRSTGTLLALRLLPTAAGLFFALTLLGSYWRYEPRYTDEPFPLGVLLTTALALGLVTLALRRALQSWRLTRTLVAAWCHHGERIHLPGTTLPAFVVQDDFPMVAVVGIVRPVLLVERQVLARLSPEELQSVVAHELGHLAARDNLRDMLMRFAPDWLSLTGLSARLHDAWSAAAEYEADDHATRSGAGPLALAGALVQVARLVPPGARLRFSASTFHDGLELEPRVTRLVARAEQGALEGPAPGRFSWWLLAPLAGLLVMLSFAPATLLAVHEAAEFGLDLLRF